MRCIHNLGANWQFESSWRGKWGNPKRGFVYFPNSALINFNTSSTQQDKSPSWMQRHNASSNKCSPWSTRGNLCARAAVYNVNAVIPSTKNECKSNMWYPSLSKTPTNPRKSRNIPRLSRNIGGPKDNLDICQSENFLVISPGNTTWASPFVCCYSTKAERPYSLANRTPGCKRPRFTQLRYQSPINSSLHTPPKVPNPADNWTWPYTHMSNP